MTTQECHQWLKRRLEQIGQVDRPDMPLEDLIAEEQRRCERIGLLLTEKYDLPLRSHDAVDMYLIYERLRFSERLIYTMAIPYSPCRVRDWTRHVWWLVGVSWLLVGAEQWRERERLRAAFPPGVHAE
jgi:hypothetical protein